MNKSNKMFGKKITISILLNRIDILEEIIFELKEILKYYSKKQMYNLVEYGPDKFVAAIELDKGKKAREVLEKYNKTWDKIYQESDSEV